MWVVQWVSPRNGSSRWRSIATEHGRGEYRVALPDESRYHLPLQLHVQLWWTRAGGGSDVDSDGEYLDEWDQQRHDVKAPFDPEAETFRPPPAFAAPVTIQCVGEALASSPLALTEQQLPAPRSPPHLGCRRAGRWVVRDSAGEHAWAHSWCDDELWGADDFDSGAIRTCLAGRRLLILGDSVTAGTYLDLCQRLGGGCQPAFAWSANHSTFKPLDPLPASPVAFAPLFGNFPARHLGLGNLVGAGAGAPPSLQEVWWEAALARSPPCVVVLQSGLHDVGVPERDRVAPLLVYRLHLRRLALFAARVRKANPGIKFVWRAMTHSLLMLDGQRDAGACRERGYPQTHPILTQRMNRLAARVLGPHGVAIWSAPEQLSFSAPSAAFRDLNHHDACGKSSALGYGTSCANARSAGKFPRASWYQGGLSEVITQTLFRTVLKCNSSGARKGAPATAQPKLSTWAAAHAHVRVVHTPPAWGGGSAPVQG